MIAGEGRTPIGQDSNKSTFRNLIDNSVLHHEGKAKPRDRMVDGGYGRPVSINSHTSGAI